VKYGERKKDRDREREREKGKREKYLVKKSVWNK